MKIALALIIIHFVADWLLQSDKMAINKSKSVYWLTIHVLVYTVILLLGTIIINWTPLSAQPVLVLNAILSYVVLNSTLHWATDFFTSKINAWIFQKGEKHRHWFFVCIGADQVIHYTCLLLTYEYFFN
jgi:hypothetical protein